MRRFFLSGLWLVPMLVWACGNGATPAGFLGYGGNGTGGTGIVGLPCEVEDVVRAQCQKCHGAQPLYGSPMPLLTPADFAASAISDPKKTVADLVITRIHDTARPMPPPPAGPLDAATLKPLEDWLAAGAPESKESCSTSASSSSSSSGGQPPCIPDIQLRGKTPWVMPTKTGDQYVCYGVDVAVTEKRHITAIAPVVNNSIIVHHMLLYETTAAANPNPTVCGAGGPANGRLVSVWAPGAQTLELPQEAGMPLEGTKHYMMQMHYSNLMHLEGQTDLSGFDLCTTTNLRANDADIMAFGTLNIFVPAHGSSDRTCDITLPSNMPTLNVFRAGPHMHKLGSAISGQVIQAGGSTVELASRDPWNFDNQYWEPTSTTIIPGDTVRIRCAWNNPTAQDVKFGEKTSDEMCYVFTAYWPRITLPSWNWQAASLLAQCNDTP